MSRGTRAAEAVTEVAYAAFSAPYGEDGLPHVLSIAQSLVGADLGGFYIHEVGGWTAPVYITPEAGWKIIPFERISTVDAAAFHPGVRHLIAARPDFPFSVTDVVPERVWLESPVARSMREHLGRHYQFAIPVPSGVVPAGENHAWVFARTNSDLSPTDRDVCDAIAPVLTAFARHRFVLRQLGELLNVGDLLTQRELLVLALQARGLGARGIGAQLGMSPRTAQKHAEHIYRKLDVHNRYEALRACDVLGIAVPHGSAQDLASDLNVERATS